MARRPDGSYEYGYYDTSNLSSYSHYADSQRKNAADAAASAARAARRRQEELDAEERRRRETRIAEDQRRIAAEAAQRHAAEAAQHHAAHLARQNTRLRAEYVEEQEHRLAIAAWNNTSEAQREWICNRVEEYQRRDKESFSEIAKWLKQASPEERNRWIVECVLICKNLWKQPGTSNLL